jgi:hypothetical protein
VGRDSGWVEKHCIKDNVEKIWINTMIRGSIGQWWQGCIFQFCRFVFFLKSGGGVWRAKIKEESKIVNISSSVEILFPVQQLVVLVQQTDQGLRVPALIPVDE